MANKNASTTPAKPEDKRMEEEEILRRQCLFRDAPPDSEGMASKLDYLEKNQELVSTTCGAKDAARLAEFVDLTRQALASGNTEVICSCSYTLGLFTQMLQCPNKIAFDLLKMIEAANSRTAPLVAKSRDNQMLKFACEHEAIQLWNADGDRSLSVGHVAQLIFDDFHAKKQLSESQLEIGYRFLAELTLPTNVSTIRKYVKKVAPDYARKPGRRPN